MFIYNVYLRISVYIAFTILFTILEALFPHKIEARYTRTLDTSPENFPLTQTTFHDSACMV